MPVPRVQPRPLDRLSKRQIAEFLGVARLPDEAAGGVEFALGAYRAAEEGWEGNTPHSNAKKLQQLDERLNRTLIELRVITNVDPDIDDETVDDETAELLFNDAEALAAAMQRFRDRVKARAATLDAMPAIRPEHEAMKQIVGWLRLTFEAFAAPHVRDNEANLRGFVITCLEADGIDTSNLKEHPARLREMLRARVVLPTPDWPRTPGVLA
jgi:hypothetical protein